MEKIQWETESAACWCQSSPTTMVAHDLSDSSLGGNILLDGQYFRDAYGRVLLLRGVNVGGASKLYVASTDKKTIRTTKRAPNICGA